MNGDFKAVLDFMGKNKGFFLSLAALIALYLIAKRLGWWDRIFGKDTPPNLKCAGGILTKAEHRSIATATYTSLSPYNWGRTGVESAFERLLNLNVGDLCGVHNSYKNKYAGTNYPTLRKLIESELITHYDLSQQRDQILGLLSQIGA